MYQLKYLIRGFFGFNQRETNGFIVLCLLLFLFLFIPSLVSKYYSSPDLSIKSDHEKLNLLLASVPSNSSTIKYEIQERSTGKSLDPNNADYLELKNLFGERIATTIINFRNKGGRFKTKEDLKKVYGMNESLFNKTYSFIVIAKPDSKNNTKVSKENVSAFDINKADTIQLESLKGIGKVLATRIIKYRTKLGGYIDKAQFKEVYGLDSLTAEVLEKRTFIVNSFEPVKISINKSIYDELASHPYISRKYAGVLISYRKNHGEFSSLEELKNIVAIPEEALVKMKPYLSL